ncbi:TauD/TfdA family dioxygenase [Actinoplanes couchii]|uniref:Protein AmbC n=1 Tax=Actinoplanes couchii TaxID=403638 RepID=A0ABQ3XTC5_9ACTN|nr:TauD/TfdA family dioxygenase [Actinoplanes couchii]MDR6324151.1 alpha-ketoglutarate-dependent taurine dioxygenase [Actinoplanes couchii]GID61769.1 protein AmbC [Actinoplanes couchii]
MTLPAQLPYPVIQLPADGSGTADLVQEIRASPDTVTARLHERGAILFRGFDPGSAQRLDAVVRAMGGEPLRYQDAATPRTEVGGRVYTSTDYPASEVIEQHNEACYGADWPRYLYFGCAIAARTGGATPLVDTRALAAALPTELIDRLREVGVRYVRTYHPRIGLTWQKAFGTDDRAEAEAWCASRGTSVEWLPGGVVRTTAVRPALVRHPDTGEECWFNQVVAFHPESLPRDLREGLKAVLAPEFFPKQVQFGDGTPISAETIDLIRRAEQPITAAVPWHTGDVLIVDNLLMSHGRQAFTGDRRVLVAMSHALTWQDVRAEVAA